ncbi:MAG TPA: hypothetical protein VL359_05050, partial [bacterium]|nr:hypothetical protein [bacterium]
MADGETEPPEGAEDSIKPHQRLLRSKGFIPTVVVIALAAFVLASPRMGGSPPRLDSLTPAKGRPQMSMVLTGRNFGATQETSEVRIAGLSVTESQIKDWSDTRVE